MEATMAKPLDGIVGLSYFRRLGFSQAAQELHRLAQKQPNRYVLDDGIWRCPPGETFAKKYGLTYHVWSSDQINWAAQDNALYLEEYYQDLERLTIPQATLETLSRLVD